MRNKNHRILQLAVFGLTLLVGSLLRAEPLDERAERCVRYGVQSLKTILAGHREASTNQPRVYVIDFARALQASGEGDTYFQDETSVTPSQRNGFPAGFQPEAWSSQARAPIEQQLAAVNADPSLEGTVIVVGLNLYLGTVQSENEIAEYDLVQGVKIIKQQRNTTLVTAKYEALRAVLTEITREVGGKYVLIAGGYFLQKDAGQNTKSFDLWGHHTSGGVSLGLAYSEVVTRLSPYKQENVREKVGAYVQSVVSVLKGIDRRVINLSTSVEGGQPVKASEIAMYDTFFESIVDMLDPTRGRVVYYSDPEDLELLENDARYKGYINPDYLLLVQVDHTGKVVTVKANFIKPYGTSECEASTKQSSEEDIVRFLNSDVYLDYHSDVIMSRVLLVSYMFYKMQVKHLSCITDRTHAQKKCCNSACEGCRFAYGFSNSLIDAVDVVTAAELAGELFSSVIKWQAKQIKKELGAFLNQDIHIPSVDITSLSSHDIFKNDPLANNLELAAIDYMLSVRLPQEIKRINHIVTLSCMMVQNAVESVPRDAYSYGWTSGFLVGLVIDPLTFESSLAKLGGRLGIHWGIAGRRAGTGDAKTILETLKVISQGDNFVILPGRRVAKSINEDGTIRALVLFEDGLIKIVGYEDLLTRVKNLPQVPESLYNELDNAFAGKTIHYSLLAKFLTKELDIKAWELLNLYGQELRKFDEKLLLQLSKLLSKQEFLQKVGGIYGLMDIIKANAAAPCCGVAGGIRKSIDQYLTDVEKYVADYQHLSGNGFEFLIQDMKNPSNAMQEGVNHAVDILTRTPPILEPQKVKKLDFVFDAEGVDCAKCKFDVEMVRPLQPESRWIKYFEFKSYKDASKIQFNQLKSYLQDIDNLSELRYIFDAGKLSPEQAKKGMQILFLERYSEIWNAGQAKSLFKDFLLKNGLPVDNAASFRDYLIEADISNPLFKFVESK